MSNRRLKSRFVQSIGAARIEMLEARQLLTTIDVMVLYSNNALAGFGNDSAAIQKAIRQSIDSANLAHQNTGDNVVLRLVHTTNLNYTSNANQDVQLDALEINSTAATLRTQYGADLVSMIVDSPQGGGGLGNLLVNPAGSPSQAFSVVGYEGIGPGSFVLAHELGHNMGGGHERDNATQYSEGTFPAYSFGYHATGVHGTDYGDVMSYQGRTLPTFSTPTFLHDGVALGQPVGNGNAADLRTTFLATAPVVANYKSTVVADAAPSASVWQTDVAGDQLTFRVRYLDDIGISAASLGNGDVYVQTPEGFQLAAELMSVDAAENGYARTATYRVTLPRNLPAVSSLGFYLTAGQVTDTAAQAAPGGQLATNIDGEFDFGFGNLALAGDTGTLVAGTTRRITNSVGSKTDFQDIWKFTVTTSMNVNLSVTGIGGALTSDPTLFVYKDANLNEVVDGTESLGNSTEIGTLDKTKSLALTAGTYYAYIQLDAGDPATNYTLTLRTAAPTPGDLTPPTAILDAADTTTTKSTVDFTVLYRDDNGIDAGSVASAKIDVTLGGAVGGGPYNQLPTSITVVDAKTVLATYQVNFGVNILPSNTTATMKVAGNSTLKDGNGNNIVTGVTLGSYTIAPSAADNTDPTAFIYSAPQILVPNGTAPNTYTIVVAYKDNRGINASTLGTGDIQVTGPHAFSQSATYTGTTSLLSAGGAIRLATYTITAPGGSWDYTDNGNYSVTVVAAQVKDNNNRNVPATTIGTFNSHVGFPGDADFDDFVNLNDLIRLANHYGQTGGTGWADGDFNFDGIINLNDLIILANNYGSAAPPAEAVADSFAADTPASMTGTGDTANDGPATSDTGAPMLIAPDPIPPVQIIVAEAAPMKVWRDSEPVKIVKPNAVAPVTVKATKPAAVNIPKAVLKPTTPAVAPKLLKPATKPVVVTTKAIPPKPAVVAATKSVIAAPKTLAPLAARKPAASVFSNVQVTNLSGSKPMKQAAVIGKK